MKLTQIKIDGYKNLTNCKFLLDDFNVLIGTNNSGKSNVLEVFSFLDTLLSGSTEIKEKFLFYGVLPEKGLVKSRCTTNIHNLFSVEIEFVISIGQETYKYWYSVSVKFGEREQENIEGYITKEYFKYKNVKATGVPITVFDRTNDEVKKFLGQRFQKIDKRETVLSIINKIQDFKDLLAEPIQKGIDGVYTICKTPVIYNSPNEIREFLRLSEPTKTIQSTVKYGRIVALELNQEITRILSSENGEYFKEVVVDLLGILKIESVKLLGDFNLVFVKFPNGVMHTLDQLSDGSLIVLNLISYLFSNKYSIIAIEELENSIHPQLLRKLIFLIKNSFSDIQIIITTHSPVLLNMVKIDEINVVTNNKLGEAKIQRVKDKKQLVKKLSGTFASFGDIFDYDIDIEE